MKAALKIIGFFGCAALVLLNAPLMGSVLLGGMLVIGSERTIYQRARSPDGWQEARVQFDDAGAVSGFERLVFVKSRWNPSDAPLMSCRAFWGHGEAQIDLSWLDDQTLLVSHHVAPQNIASVASNCGSVKINVKAVRPYEEF